LNTKVFWSLDISEINSEMINKRITEPKKIN
jgi:hypothetical protein